MFAAQYKEWKIRLVGDSQFQLKPAPAAVAVALSHSGLVKRTNVVPMLHTVKLDAD